MMKDERPITFACEIAESRQLSFLSFILHLFAAGSRKYLPAPCPLPSFQERRGSGITFDYEIAESRQISLLSLIF